MAADRPILIAGGGIGGLALAIALARRGLPSRILERRAQFAEAGAGIQLGPNAVGTLIRLGVAPRLEPLTGKPQFLSVHDGGSGSRLASLPLGEWIEKRHGAPYWVAHRADLHTALLDTAVGLSEIEIITGWDVSVIESRHGVRLISADGRTCEGGVLVGADGLWSTVRRHLFPGREPVYAGRTAARALVDPARAAARFRENCVGVWLAPAAHVVHYPIRGGKEIALVVVLEDEWPGEGWGLPVDREHLLARLAPFAAELREFLGLAPEWRRWPLYDPAPLPCWSSGLITLLGDAAHPVLPFLAQGGALAIEDAETLAALLAVLPGDPVTALARYAAARRPRAERIQRASRRNGIIYHLGRPASLARDLTLRTLPGRHVMAMYDWVYAWPRT